MLNTRSIYCFLTSMDFLGLLGSFTFHTVLSKTGCLPSGIALNSQWNSDLVNFSGTVKLLRDLVNQQTSWPSIQSVPWVQSKSQHVENCWTNAVTKVLPKYGFSISRPAVVKTPLKAQKASLEQTKQRLLKRLTRLGLVKWALPRNQFYRLANWSRGSHWAAKSCDSTDGFGMVLCRVRDIPRFRQCLPQFQTDLTKSEFYCTSLLCSIEDWGQYSSSRHVSVNFRPPSRCILRTTQ